LWELAPWLAGAADFADRPSLERVSSAAQSLAELHEILAGIGTGGEAPLPVTDRSAQQLDQARELILGGGLSSACPAMTHWGWPAELLPVERSLRQGCEMATRRLAPLRDLRLARQWVWGDAWQR